MTVEGSTAGQQIEVGGGAAGETMVGVRSREMRRLVGGGCGGSAVPQYP
jgi:hypothetical protein